MSDYELDLPFIAFIPYNVQIDQSISDACKIYYGQIVGLAKKSGYMWATDQQLAKMKNVSIRTIERWNNQLENAGHIIRDTQNVPVKDESGNYKWIKKRKVFFNDGFQTVEKPKKEVSKSEVSKKVCETAIDVGTCEPDKNVGTCGPDKSGGIINTYLDNNTKKQCDSAKPVVVSSFYELEIQEKLRNKILLKYSVEEIELAVKRCLNWKSRPNDEVGIMTALTKSDSWSDNSSPEEVLEKNAKYLNSLKHLDGTYIANTRITVGNKYIEFVSGMKVKVFEIEQNEFKKLVANYIEHLQNIQS